jgi:hypothetical protein
MIQVRNSESYLDKASILSHISEYDIFRFYCPAFKDIAVKFCSELRKDQTPTCSIVPWNGRLLYKDFGTGDTFDCFDYVMTKYGLKFSECLRVIDTDFGLGLGSGQAQRSQVALTYGRYELPDRKAVVIKKKARPFTKLDEDFWGQYHISIELVKFYGIEAIDYFWINEFRYRAEPLAYAYKFESRFKIYQPKSSKETKWFSNTTKDDIQGFKQLPESGDIVFLASSLKDVMCLKVLGYPAVALQGEMQMPNSELITELQKRFKVVAVLYDNDFQSDDNPGQRMANKVCMAYNLINVILPAHYKSKDISDFVRDHGLDAASRIINIQLP